MEAMTMRFLVMVKATDDSEAGELPSTEGLKEMGRYNEELVKAGILLAVHGLHPSSKGARVRFEGDDRTVIDGPFAETKELVAGFWIGRSSRPTTSATTRRPRCGPTRPDGAPRSRHSRSSGGTDPGGRSCSRSIRTAGARRTVPTERNVITDGRLRRSARCG